jgi:hypothetical protein
VVNVADIRTNRDLYLAVADLAKRDDSSRRSLEEYLRAIWGLASIHRAGATLLANEFFTILSEAFTADVPPFFADWANRYQDDVEEHRNGYEGWENRILRQIVDLHEMNESGQLADPQRYFGINSPRGQRWYNFDPSTFLECAVAGSYGGWEPGDDTGRNFVSGPVAVMGADGRITDCDPRDIDRPVNPIPEVSWDDFRDFLGQGQWYE